MKHSGNPQPEFPDRFAGGHQPDTETSEPISLARRQAELITLLDPKRHTSTSLSERYQLAEEHFVTNEPNERLRSIGEVFVTAHHALEAEQRIGKARSLRDGLTDPTFIESTPYAKRKQIGKRVSELYYGFRDQLIEFNHVGRNLVDQAGPELGREGLVDMVTAGAHGNRRWAERMVSGWVTEHAISELLEYTPGVSEVRAGTVAEDREGGDLVIRLLNGKEFLVDAKSEPGTAMHVSRDGDQLTISVDHQYIGGDCRLDPQYNASFRDKLTDRIYPLAA